MGSGGCTVTDDGDVCGDGGVGWLLLLLMIIVMMNIISSGAGIAQLVVLGLAVHSVAGSILLWGHFR